MDVPAVACAHGWRTPSTSGSAAGVCLFGSRGERGHIIHLPRCGVVHGWSLAGTLVRHAPVLGILDASKPPAQTAGGRARRSDGRILTEAGGFSSARPRGLRLAGRRCLRIMREFAIPMAYMDPL
ncbi:hypothetical protein ppKF707_1558 [Metapseudomonas furukawaii]|uniref:Uncharacterized protein n=1 Tax=Metapseudomonas furukawaii TaxID=1149133 RepID=A0AAD1C0H1_METFU|nr:hypothetical protein ppKF707_1558 [Pseudomonas furukawaii]BAU75061.1 hypothetical protein KF707C_33730 [Pseudomonas furukawaii]